LLIQHISPFFLHCVSSAIFVRDRRSVTDSMLLLSLFFFFKDTATTEIYTLSLHDALPILIGKGKEEGLKRLAETLGVGEQVVFTDRKSTRLNSSHVKISYAVFCLKKKKKKKNKKLP